MNDVTSASAGSASSLTRVAFWYLRHGETAWNALNLSQGRVDNPLNASGIAQAHAAASLLRYRGIASIVASPLTRARVTAEIVGQALGLPITYDQDLQEVSYGVQEGQPMSEWFTEWVADRFTPEGGESFSQLRARSVIAANRALTHTPVVLIVAHGALFRALRAEMGLTASVRTQNAQPLFCEPPTRAEPAWTLTPAA
jgi:probable phosphoglycerate mutase